MNKYVFEWDRTAFKKKRPFGPAVTFIAASRHMTDERIKQIIKKYLPKGDIVWGIAAGEHIEGFDGQPQFKSLRLSELEPWIEKTNEKSPHKIYVLRHTQDNLEDIISPMNAKNYVFVRGSWQYTFHTQPVYHKLTKRDKAFEFISPFASENEAKEYAGNVRLVYSDDFHDLGSPQEFIDATSKAARASYDHSFQVGALLANKAGYGEYSYVDSAHNQVVPYETYAMHHGFSREEHLTPSQDLNHYDTVHAETMLLIKRKNVKDMSLFVNVMPCGTCARAIVASGISEVFYSLPHSNGYAEGLFKASGIRSERIVS